jgi:glucokinase
MKSAIVLGVDIGGSHITAKLVDLDKGSTLKETETREDVNAKGTAAEILTAWYNVIKKTIEKGNVSVQKIGIAMPGPFDYENGIAWMQNQDKYDSLYGLNVKELLSGKLNLSPSRIKFVNDAEGFLKGEVFNGAAKNISRSIGITLGTGLGSAKCINGITTDADLWHSPFLNGIAEDYLSTRWFVHRYAELSNYTVSGVKELTSLKDDYSQQVFSEFGKNLILFLSGNDILQYRPEAIVLGGNISNAYFRFADDLQNHLKKFKNFPFIRKAILGEEGALIGAASCWQKVGNVVTDNTVF